MATKRLMWDEGEYVSELTDDIGPNTQLPSYDRTFPVVELPDELIERHRRVMAEWDALMDELAAYDPRRQPAI